MFDFNEAEVSKPKATLIPDGTIVPVHMTLRPGGAGPMGWLKLNKNGDCEMIDAEFTVVGGDWERRKFWNLFTVVGETEGQKKAVDISKSNIRAILESARGVHPSDMSEEAMKARRISSYEELDGLRFWVGVKLEPENGAYKASNRLKFVVTPDQKEWSKLDQVASAPKAAPAAAVARATASAPPAWAAKKVATNDARIPY